MSFRYMLFFLVFFCFTSSLKAQELLDAPQQPLEQKQAHIVGVEPSIGDLLDNFKETMDVEKIKDVYSAFELQDFWLEDLKNESGPVLLIAEEGRVRLMRLQRKNTIKPYH